MKRNRFTAFLLVLAMSVSLSVPALALEFSDMDASHWAWEDVQTCAELGIVTGFEDGSFKPEDNVTSVEFIVMMTRTFYADKLREVTTPAGQPWYYANTKVAADVGMSTGLASIDEKAINRYNMALVAYNTCKANNKTANTAQARLAQSKITDYSSVPDDFRQPVKQCYAQGIITGMDDGSFEGEGNMTRAQACAVIVRMRKLLDGVTEPNTPAQPEQPNRGDSSALEEAALEEYYKRHPEARPTQPDQPAQPEAPAETGTGKLANGQDATVENVQAILEEIKAEYPVGTVWDENGTDGNYYAAGPGAYENTRDVGLLRSKHPGPNGASVDLQYACGGWAAMVSERIFGYTGAPGRQVNSISEMRPGDIIFDIDPKTGACTHISICYKVGQVNGQWRFSATSGNTNGKVSWSENLSGSTLSNKNITRYVYTRYPES